MDEERGDANACPLIDGPNTELGPFTSRRMNWKIREKQGDSRRAQEAKEKWKKKPKWGHHNAHGI